MAGKLDVNSRAAQDSPTSSSVAVAINGERNKKPADNATRGNCSLEPHLASRLQTAHRQWTEDVADGWQAAAPPSTGAGGSSGPCITYDRADRRARPHRPRGHVMPAQSRPARPALTRHSSNAAGVVERRHAPPSVRAGAGAGSTSCTVHAPENRCPVYSVALFCPLLRHPRPGSLAPSLVANPKQT